ncbi:MAG: protein-methionine-sulfoxide reductase catalytic subunit MsrP [Alphaproteobacteria bacterium]
MLIKVKKGWELPESAVTPEAVYLNRRAFMATAAAGTIAGATLLNARSAAADETEAWNGLYPVARNETYQVDRELTPEGDALTYNNFYEFGSSKSIADRAQALTVRPWTITIDGLVEQEMTLDIDDLLARVSLEERVYRHRCVEAWSMTVPWSGFPVSQLVEIARPLGSAKYLQMTTFEDPEVAPGQQQSWYPWPYVEGLTMAEATNDLAFMVTGLYGKPVAKQNGAPLRLHAPWKYGFKSVKSIVNFRFTEERPHTFWEVINPDEYGFWANVNPEVSHPRWSQAYERVLHTGERVPTLLFNGYGEFVADLYAGMDDEALYM